ncbi:odorant receptor 71 isoform X1 [Nasonia vitripennis]|uniref:Odorant receptor n=1 Tax=Nasonia vitripennis TaxID=7425 RepID=A0A7M7QD77_NASVI|nr:odorant receptor 71 isoform X1 [Nasonia vitripennis]
MYDEIFIRPHKISLKLIGAWPGYAKLTGFFLVIGSSSVLLFFALWNTIEVFGNLELLVDNLVNVIGIIVGFFKLTTLRVKRRNLIFMVDTMFEDWQTSKKTIEELNAMKDHFERSKWLCKSIIMLYNSLILTFLLKPVRSYMNDSIEGRQYLAPVSFPKFIDAKQSPIYEIVIIGEIGTAFFCINSHALVEGLLASTVLHASAKIAAVRQEIIRFSKVCRSQNSNKRLIISATRRLVQVHLSCNEFSETIVDIFAVISFFSILLMTLAQVFSGYMFIFVQDEYYSLYVFITVAISHLFYFKNIENGGETVQTLHYGFLTIVFLVSSGYFCIAGEHLANQSELLTMEIYNCFWSEFRIPEQKAIRFILAQSQRPVRLTLGKFDELNLVYLTKIIKTSFSYLSLVRRVR